MVSDTETVQLKYSLEDIFILPSPNNNIILKLGNKVIFIASKLVKSGCFCEFMCKREKIKFAFIGKIWYYKTIFFTSRGEGRRLKQFFHEYSWKSYIYF